MTAAESQISNDKVPVNDQMGYWKLNSRGGGDADQSKRGLVRCERVFDRTLRTCLTTWVTQVLLTTQTMEEASEDTGYTNVS